MMKHTNLIARSSCYLPRFTSTDPYKSGINYKIAECNYLTTVKTYTNKNLSISTFHCSTICASLRILTNPIFFPLPPFASHTPARENR